MSVRICKYDLDVQILPNSKWESPDVKKHKVDLIDDQENASFDTEQRSSRFMVRNETASSLGNRVIGDEREEVWKANSTLNLTTRFVNAWELQNSKSFKFRNLNISNLRPKTSLMNYEGKNKLETFDYNDDSTNFATERNTGNQILHNVWFRGEVEIVKHFLDRNNIELSLNQLNRQQMTPLDCAIENRKLEVIKLLLNQEKLNINIGGGK